MRLSPKVFVNQAVLLLPNREAESKSKFIRKLESEVFLQAGNSDCSWRNRKFVAALRIVRIKSDSTPERVELQP